MIQSYATTSPADAEALRALGCRYEDLDKPPIIQEAEDVILATPAQIIALERELSRLQTENRRLMEMLHMSIEKLQSIERAYRMGEVQHPYWRIGYMGETARNALDYLLSLTELLDGDMWSA